MQQRKVVIFGAAGRVGSVLAQSLSSQGIKVVAVDFLAQSLFEAQVARLSIDNVLQQNRLARPISVRGNFDVLNKTAICDLLAEEKPDIVVNYAIPFTWDAAKTLPNYAKISAACLGAFTAIQVLAPKLISEAIAETGVDAKLIVGNLPCITIPVIHGLASTKPMCKPVAGAGNVGLIAAGLRAHIARSQNLQVDQLDIWLTAHHVHWVVPREPGYKDDAPFYLKVCYQGKDITDSLGDLRQLMNQSIVACYEPGAAFSSTTGLLASQLVTALLDNSRPHYLHSPAPNGLPGGYPVLVENGDIQLNLPEEWEQQEVVNGMLRAHQRDGIEHIHADGTIDFDKQSIAILKQEMNFELPERVTPDILEDVALAQIKAGNKALGR